MGSCYGATAAGELLWRTCCGGAAVGRPVGELLRGSCCMGVAVRRIREEPCKQLFPNSFSPTGWLLLSTLQLSSFSPTAPQQQLPYSSPAAASPQQLSRRSFQTAAPPQQFYNSSSPKAAYPQQPSKKFSCVCESRRACHLLIVLGEGG